MNNQLASFYSGHLVAMVARDQVTSNDVTYVEFTYVRLGFCLASSEPTEEESRSHHACVNGRGVYEDVARPLEA